MIQKLRGVLPAPPEDAAQSANKKKKDSKRKDKKKRGDKDDDKGANHRWKSMMPHLLMREDCTPAMKLLQLQQHAIAMRSEVFAAFAAADRERIGDWEPRTLGPAFLDAPSFKCVLLLRMHPMHRHSSALLLAIVNFIF